MSIWFMDSVKFDKELLHYVALLKYGILISIMDKCSFYFFGSILPTYFFCKNYNKLGVWKLDRMPPWIMHKGCARGGGKRRHEERILELLKNLLVTMDVMEKP